MRSVETCVKAIATMLVVSVPVQVLKLLVTNSVIPAWMALWSGVIGALVGLVFWWYWWRMRSFETTPIAPIFTRIEAEICLGAAIAGLVIGLGG